MQQEALIGLLWAALVVALAAFGLVALAVAGLAIGVLALGALVLRGLAGQSSVEARLVELETAVSVLGKREAPGAAARSVPEIGAVQTRLSGLAARVEALEAVEVPAVTEPQVAAAPVQPELPMLEPPGDVVLSRAQIVRALNFPEDAGDEAGFAVLRQALARRDLAELLQAAEDCLNYLSQDMLYMDDLLMEPAGAEEWRAFARGGRARAALLPIQGIRDEAAMLSVQAKMRSDAVFRDTALVFQRRFDVFLSEYAVDADDAELLALMDTRTGRAFVLFAQVNGSLTA